MPMIAMAQAGDSVRAPSFVPTGVRFGMDLIAPVRSVVEDDFTGWEFYADVDFYRYYLTIERGQWERTLANTTERYANDGSYWRVGVDVNFLKKDPDKNMLFIGYRYGNGKFSESLQVLSNSTWNSGTFSYATSNASASWFELTAGLRVKIWKPVWLGYTARYKFGLRTGDLLLVPHEVPGFGRTDKKSTWGFNYQLFIRLGTGSKSVLSEK